MQPSSNNFHFFIQHNSTNRSKVGRGFFFTPSTWFEQYCRSLNACRGSLQVHPFLPLFTLETREGLVEHCVCHVSLDLQSVCRVSFNLIRWHFLAHLRNCFLRGWSKAELEVCYGGDSCFTHLSTRNSPVPRVPPVDVEWRCDSGPVDRCGTTARWLGSGRMFRPGCSASLPVAAPRPSR